MSIDLAWFDRECMKIAKAKWEERMEGSFGNMGAKNGRTDKDKRYHQWCLLSRRQCFEMYEKMEKRLRQMLDISDSLAPGEKERLLDEFGLK